MYKHLIYLCLTVVLLIACGDDPIDPCAGVDCGINGICLSGACDCEDGYSGMNCEIFDSCFNVDCSDKGICEDGACDCELGYYGERCELLVQDRFVGTWSGIDCEGEIFNLVIQEGATIESLVIQDDFFNINANIVDEDSFEIPEQEFIVLSIIIQLEGIGNILDDGRLSFDATITTDGSAESCMIVLVRG